MPAKRLPPLPPTAASRSIFSKWWAKGRALAVPPLPFIAVPTTAGTGSEVTRNAVLGSPEHGVKASLRSPLMLPRVALVDPELTYGLPPAVTAFTGLDALTQLIEPYVSARANPLDRCALRRRHRARCRRAAPRVSRRRGPRGAPRYGAGQPVRRPGAGQRRTGCGARLRGAARRRVEGAARRALCGAVAARHGGQCRGIAGARTATSRPWNATPPSLACLPAASEASAEDGIDWVRALCAELNVPPLRAWGIAEADCPAWSRRRLAPAA